MSDEKKGEWILGGVKRVESANAGYTVVNQNKHTIVKGTVVYRCGTPLVSGYRSCMRENKGVLTKTMLKQLKKCRKEFSDLFPRNAKEVKQVLQSFAKTAALSKDRDAIERCQQLSRASLTDQMRSMRLSQNAFAEDDESDSHLYYFASFFNHACRPSCNYTCIKQTLTITTMFDVAPGEELTIHYSKHPVEFNLFMFSNNPWIRPMLFPLHYGWDCACRYCLYVQRFAHLPRSAPPQLFSSLKPKKQKNERERPPPPPSDYGTLRLLSDVIVAAPEDENEDQGDEGEKVQEPPHSKTEKKRPELSFCHFCARSGSFSLEAVQRLLDEERLRTEGQGQGPVVAETKTPISLGTVPFRCQRCRVATYCSRDCQLRDWHVVHSFFCAD